MDEPSHRVTAHKSQQPQDYQYYSNRPQHSILLSIRFRLASAGSFHDKAVFNSFETLRRASTYASLQSSRSILPYLDRHTLSESALPLRLRYGT